jgi:hypothetical protein
MKIDISKILNGKDYKSKKFDPEVINKRVKSLIKRNDWLKKSLVSPFPQIKQKNNIKLILIPLSLLLVNILMFVYNIISPLIICMIITGYFAIKNNN